MRWGRAGIFGAITFVLAFLSSLNEFPLQEFGYPTTDSYGSFLTNRLMQMLLSALASGVFILLLTAWAAECAEPGLTGLPPSGELGLSLLGCRQ